MNKEEYREKFQQNIPQKPGVYKYYDIKKRILYVGKAKNLRKRVNSYFSKNNADQKTNELVRRIHSIDYHIVPSESEALLLENNLIKSLRPPFNINLKDNKNYYPTIVIYDEDFPRVRLTRKTVEDPIAEKYGPFTNITSAYSVIDYINEQYKLRTCNLDLSPKELAKKKYRTCLQYHIKKCKAPCVGLQTLEDYESDIEEIKKILAGNLGEVQRSLKSKLQNAVETLDFEKAEELKNRLDGLGRYQSRSIITSQKLKDVDVIAYDELDDVLYFTFFHIQNGKLVTASQKEIAKKYEEDNQSILLHILLVFRQETGSDAPEVIVSDPVDMVLEDILFTVPKIGIKKKLLDMAIENSELYSQRKTTEDLPEVRTTDDTLQDIQDKLRLKNYPRRIECFDNSNTQGSHPVAAMVSFLDGKPDKSNYRKFNIKSVEGPDDFKSMQEVVFRRYRRQLEEYKELPDLIIIDGGKGQLSAAVKSLKQLKLMDTVDVVGLAKKKEEIFLPGHKDSVMFDFDSDALNLIRRVRDEVHRFGITFHRQKRSKHATKSMLDDLYGVGPKSKEKLLTKYKSIEKIKKASLEDLEKIVNKSVARIVYDTFHQKKLD